MQKVKGVEAFHIKEAGHSFNVIIKGGDDNEIAQAIWQSKPIGVQTEGQIGIELKDFLDQPCHVRFSRPEIIPISLKANLKIAKIKDEEISTHKTQLKKTPWPTLLPTTLRWAQRFMPPDFMRRS